MPKRYALLVGIDQYLRPKRGDERQDVNGQNIPLLVDLKGCVNDVESYKAILRDHYKFDHIDTLVSPLPSHSHIKSVINGTPSILLPTFENIQKSFNNIKSIIAREDVFYFHFSGHGALLSRLPGKSPPENDKDASLMPADYCRKQPALRGWQLNRWLEELNERKVQVVVSLDSCYSGAAWRMGDAAGVRTPEEWPEVANLPIDEEAVKDEKPSGLSEPEFRDAEVRASWSLNPDAFTVLAACQPNQVAKEVHVAAKKLYHGAFTSGLVNYLTKNNYYVSYRMAREYLQESLKPQTPLAFGRDRLLFLGSSEPFTTNPIAYRVEEGKFHIQVGSAHGITEGTEFTPFPLPGDSSSQVTVSTDYVGKFNSSATKVSKEVAKVLEEHNGQTVITSRWCFGKEKPLRVLVDPKIGDGFMNLLSKSLQSRIVSPVHVEVDRHGGAGGPQDLTDMTFRLTTKEGIVLYGPELVTGHQEPVGTVMLGRDDTKPEMLAAEVAAPLVHLARLGHTLGMKSPPSQPFTVSLLPIAPKDQAPMEVKEHYEVGQWFRLTFNNTGSAKLYFAVLNITPEFKVRQIFPSQDRSEEVGQPGQVGSAEVHFDFDTILPPDFSSEFVHLHPRKNRRDIFRIVVSTSPAVTWKALELPAIWDAEKVHVSGVHNFRDVEIRDVEEWWFCDKHILSTDPGYKPPHPESLLDSLPKDTQSSKTPVTPVTPRMRTTARPHSTPKKEPGRGQSPSARDGNAYGITGIPKSPYEDIPIRKDVDEWYHEQTAAEGNRIQLTLFTEALTEIQQRPLTDEMSYFRLAGIHAAPYAGWGGFDNPKEEEDRSFCVHNDYTFPTWHRVYVTLFEQVLYEAMIKFIDGASILTPEVRADWKKEARRWRLPYWDFARFPTHGNTASKELRLPILATLPTVLVKVFGSGGRLVSKPNPLYKFQTQTRMGDLEPPYAISSVANNENGEEVGIPFDKCLSTTKYGLLDGYHADVWADGGQNWLRANLALNEHPWNLDNWNSVATLQDMTYRLLKVQNASWGAFATTRYPREDAGDDVDDPKTWLSLEAVHNNVHSWVGGFWFNRPAEADKLKLWGAGHMAIVEVAAFDPIFWLHHCNIDRLTAIWQSLNPEEWFNDVHSQQSRENELKPFRNSQGFTFKSDDVQDWRYFNYDYAITSGERDRTEIMQDVDTLYGLRTLEQYRKSRSQEDYIISVKYNRYAIGGRPFQINVFLGHVDGKDFYDSRSTSFVGSVFNFSGDVRDSQCSNCTRQQGDGVRSVSQFPATLAMNYAEPQSRSDPKLFYVVINSQGRSEQEIEVEVKLHRAERMFYEPPNRFRGGGDDYHLVAVGRPAKVDY